MVTIREILVKAWYFNLSIARYIILILNHLSFLKIAPTDTWGAITYTYVTSTLHSKFRKCNYRNF